MLKKLVLLALLPVLSVLHAADDEVLLRYNLQKGDSLRVIMEMDMDIRQNIGGLPINIGQVMTMEYRYDVTSRDPDSGDMDITVRYEEIALEMSGIMGTISFDTRDPESEAPEFLMALAGLKGAEFKISTSPQGLVLDVSGVGRIMRDLLSDLGSGQEAEAVRAMLEQDFNDEAMKNSFQNMNAYYPDGPVGIGAKWKQKTTLQFLMPIRIVNKYELVSMEDGKVGLAVNTRFKMKTMGGDFLGMEGLGMKLKGTQSSLMTVETESGIVLDGTIEQVLAGRISMEKQSWPIEVESRITVKSEFIQGE